MTNFSSINIGFDNGNKFLRNDCPLDFSTARFCLLLKTPGYATDAYPFVLYA